MGLKTIVGGLLAGSGGKIMRNLGLGFITYGISSVLITAALASLVAAVGGLPSEALAFFLLCGGGQAISIMGAGILTASLARSQGVGLGKTS